jgi:hypothetical protein
MNDILLAANADDQQIGVQGGRLVQDLAGGVSFQDHRFDGDPRADSASMKRFLSTSS